MGRAAGQLFLPKRPALVLLVALLIPAAVIITANFFAVGAFGLDYRVFRYAARLPVEEIYQPRVSPFVYPPTAIAPFRPLGIFPVTIGYLAWSIISVGVFVYATRRIDRHAVILAVASTVFLKALLIGQTTIILGALIIAACLKRGIVSGLLLGLVVAIKPQLVILAPLAFLARREWSVLGGMILGALCMLMLELALYGIQPWIAWFAAISGFHAVLIRDDLLWIMVNPAGVAEHWGLPSLPFLLLGICLGVVAVLRRARHVEDAELAALISITSAISVPYAIATDLIAPLPCVALLVLRGRLPIQISAIAILTLAYMPIGLIGIALMWAIGSAPDAVRERTSPHSRKEPDIQKHEAQ